MRVLVTRPEPGAGRTAKRLRQRGHDPVVLPLSRIVPVTPNPVPSTLGFLGTIITSSNAVTCMPVALHRRLSELPCHVVGEHTAEAALTSGFDVRSMAMDTDELAKLLTDEFQSGARLAYACGRVRRPALQAALERNGIELFAIEVYDTIQFSYATDYILETLSGPPIEAVLAYSVVAARQIRDFLVRADTSKKLFNTTIYCLSERVASEFHSLNGIEVLSAKLPTEQSLLELLVQQR